MLRSIALVLVVLLSGGTFAQAGDGENSAGGDRREKMRERREKKEDGLTNEQRQKLMRWLNEHRHRHHRHHRRHEERREERREEHREKK